MLAVTSANAAPSQQDAIKALDEVVEELNALERWFTGAERKRLGWLNDIEAADRRVIDLNDRIDATRAELTETTEALAGLTAREDRLNRDRRRQAELINEHLATAYRLSGQDFVKTLLNQHSADDVTRMMRYHGYFSAARLDTIADYQQTLTALRDVRDDLETTSERYATQAERMERERKELVSQRSSRQALLARLESEISDKTNARARLRADRGRLQSLIEALRQRAGRLDGSDFAASKGQLPWPVAGTIQHRYGQTLPDGRLRWHGTRFAASEGTEITAVFRGRVAFANWLRGYGLLTIVDHGGGYMTLYGHADALIKAEGDWVESGETIGRSGQSGGQTSNGVYFEIRHKGKHDNPARWLAGK